MNRFEFRTRRIFESKDKYERSLKIIERIKKRCHTQKILEFFDRHPGNAFDSMSLPNDETEEYLQDDFTLFFDSADNLVNLNKEISGKYGWEAIANVIDIQTGVGINDWHWTRRTFQLKPEYVQILIENLNSIEKEIKENYKIFLAEEKEEEEKLEKIKKSISSIETSVRTITDEGGRTKEYKHIITLKDGEKLGFSERNVFDFGVTINPLYSVVPGESPGGLCLTMNEVLTWCTFEKGEGWVPLRPLTENENTAMTYLWKFGGFSDSGIRM